MVIICLFELCSVGRCLFCFCVQIITFVLVLTALLVLFLFVCSVGLCFDGWLVWVGCDRLSVCLVINLFVLLDMIGWWLIWVWVDDCKLFGCDGQFNGVGCFVFYNLGQFLLVHVWLGYLNYLRVGVRLVFAFCLRVLVFDGLVVFICYCGCGQTFGFALVVWFRYMLIVYMFGFVVG